MPTKQDAKEYQMLANSVREFATRELLPRLAENDRYPVSDGFATAMVKAMELDYFHAMLTEELNGWGGKITPLGLILKNIAEVDASLGAILLTNAVAQEIFTQAGAGEVLREIVAAAETPREFLVAYPLLMHPDDDEIGLLAESTDGRYALTGQAEYVVLGPMARRALLPAKIAARPDYAYFLVDLEQPSIRMEGPVLGMGLHACPAADLVLNHADGRLIGGTDEGSMYFDRAMTRMLPAAAAVSCGLMQGSLKEALHYSRKRKQGGRKILDWSELRLIMADMALTARTADILLAQALHAVDADKDKWSEDAYTAAIYILDAACELTSNGIQALGGYGYTKHHFQERRFRDAQHLRSVFGSANPRKLEFVKKCLNW